MAGLSTKLYDTGSIELIGTHSAAAISGASVGGRALSDVAHGAGAGIRVFDILLTQFRSVEVRQFGGGFVDTDGNLTLYVGQDPTTIGTYLGSNDNQLTSYSNSLFLRYDGVSQNVVGTRLRCWVNTANRKVWVTSFPRKGFLVSDAINARPDTDTAPSYTISGSSPLRAAITPGYGSGSDRNVIRFLSRYAELPGELYGALPWDARAVTINLVMREAIGGAYIAEGTEVNYAVFEQASPDQLLTPTTVSTEFVGPSGALALPATISVDPGSPISVLVSTTVGTPGVQARSHYMPVVAP